MEQTAVEWLLNQLENQVSDDGKQTMSLKVTGFLREQAKEMEKEQLIDCGNSCALKQHLHSDRINKMNESELRQFAEEEHLTFGEQYYNETFKNK